MSISRLEIDDIDLLTENAPQEFDESSALVYREKSVKDKLKFLIPKVNNENLGIRGTQVIFLEFIILFLALVFSDPFLPISSETMAGIVVFSIFIIPFTPRTIVSVLVLLTRWIHQDKIYIISDDYIVETVSGRLEVSKQKKTYIDRGSLVDMKIDNSQLIFKGDGKEISIDSNDKNSIKEIHDELLFSK